MKTRITLWILAIMMMMPDFSYAQNDNQKSDKKIEKAAAIAGGALVGAAVLGSLFKKKNKNKQETETTAMAAAFSIFLSLFWLSFCA